MMKKLLMIICLCAFALSAVLPAGKTASAFVINDYYIYGEFSEDEIIVRFHPREMFPGQEHAWDRTIQRLNRAGTYQMLADDNTFVIRENMRRNANSIVRRWQNNPFVDYAEPNFKMQYHTMPNDPSYWQHQRSYLQQINAEAGWAIVNSGGPIVAVLDSGIINWHQDLNVMPLGYSATSSMFPSNLNPFDDTTNSDAPHGHGTAVAGVIGATGDNGIGVTGINWDAQIMSVKVDNAQGVIFLAAVADGIRWAANNGARIMNISLGATQDTQSLRNAVNFAVNDMGTLIVAAAGNHGSATQPNNPGVTFPARYANVIGVAASHDGHTRVSYSNHGTGVDITAMGHVFTLTSSGGFAWMAGTSFAAPMVAGLASLIWEILPDAPNTLVRDLILDNARTMLGGFNNMTGHGLIDMHATLMAARSLDINLPAGVGSVFIDNWVFGDSASSPLILSSTSNVSTATVWFTGRDGTSFNSGIAPAFAGSYTIYVRFRATMEHSSFTVSHDFEIAPRPITIQILDLTKTFFDDCLPEWNIITGSLVTSHYPQISFFVNGSPLDRWLSVGTHTVWGINENPNYSVIFVPATLTVNPANASIWMNPTIISGGVYGQTLLHWQLPMGWSWADPTQTPTRGANTFTAVFDMSSDFATNFYYHDVDHLIDTDTFTIMHQVSFYIAKQPDWLLIGLIAVGVALIVSLITIFAARKLST